MNTPTAAQSALNNKLILAVDKNQIATVQELLEKGADIHTLKDAPIRIAVTKDFKEMIQVLLRNGAPKFVILGYDEDADDEEDDNSENASEA